MKLTAPGLRGRCGRLSRAGRVPRLVGMRIAIAGGTGTLRALLVPVPLPGKLGRVLRGGVLTAGQPDVRGTARFEEWLAAARG